jgi:hypothetical protein
MVTRHEFLAQLHGLVEPVHYLEIGVQYGYGLATAQPGTLVIGVDPNPLVNQVLPAAATTKVHPVTSDHYFAAPELHPDPPIDLAFIDGLHLFEAALRDFMGVELHGHRRTVVLFDDTLPRNHQEAAREMCPGDWTGDVWKLIPILTDHRPDLLVLPVDTWPTGTLLVFGLDPQNAILHDAYEAIEEQYLGVDKVPDTILNRIDAWRPEKAVERLRGWLNVHNPERGRQ